MNVNDQHKKWMKIALEYAKQALSDGEFPVGCILVAKDRDEIVATGIRQNSKESILNEIDHAEICAIKNWVISGKKGTDVWAYVTLEPCLMCLGALIINGVKGICFAYEDVMGGATGIFFKEQNSIGHPELDLGYEIRDLYFTSNLKIVPWILREDSLKLFKEFFLKPDNKYLSDTLLARYTLKTV